jgi:hypothetical protein
MLSRTRLIHQARHIGRQRIERIGGAVDAAKPSIGDEKLSNGILPPPAQAGTLQTYGARLLHCHDCCIEVTEACTPRMRLIAGATVMPYHQRRELDAPTPNCRIDAHPDKCSAPRRPAGILEIGNDDWPARPGMPAQLPQPRLGEDRKLFAAWHLEDVDLAFIPLLWHSYERCTTSRQMAARQI